jgi:hypothetical protein
MDHRTTSALFLFISLAAGLFHVVSVSILALCASVYECLRIDGSEAVVEVLGQVFSCNTKAQGTVHYKRTESAPLPKSRLWFPATYYPNGVLKSTQGYENRY